MTPATTREGDQLANARKPTGAPTASQFGKAPSGYRRGPSAGTLGFWRQEVNGTQRKTPSGFVTKLRVVIHPEIEESLQIHQGDLAFLLRSRFLLCVLRKTSGCHEKPNVILPQERHE
jgi:hypothetical protein